MNNVKKLTAVTILSALAVTPAFAHAPRQAYDVKNFQGSYDPLGTGHFRGAYNQAPLNGPYYIGAPFLRGPIGEDLQFDRSFPGGHDSDFNPAGT